MRETIQSIFMSSTNDFCFVLSKHSASILTKSLEYKARSFNSAEALHSCCFDEKLQRLYLSSSQGLSMMDFRSLYPMEFGHDCSVTVCAIDSYWHRIYTGSVDTTIIAWSLKTCKPEKVLVGHKEAITGLELFEWGQLLSSSLDFTVRRWNAITGECLQVLEEDLSEVRTIVLNPKTNVIMTGTQKGIIKVWRTDKLLGEFKLFKSHEAHKQAINKISCCIEEDRYLSASDDATVIIWS